MHRGYFKQWRKLCDSAIWQKPPLYLKVFLWLQANVNRKTAALTTTFSQLQEAVSWEERGCPRHPNRKTLSRILQWLETEQMIRRKTLGKGNTQYTQISLVKWRAYQQPHQAGGTKEGTLYKKVQEVQEQTLPPSSTPARVVLQKGRPYLERKNERFHQLNRDRKAAEERRTYHAP